MAPRLATQQSKGSSKSTTSWDAYGRWFKSSQAHKSARDQRKRCMLRLQCQPNRVASRLG